MESEWMGRYRPFVAELIRQGNIAIKSNQIKHDIGDGILLNNNEWQVLEYIVEHRYDDDHMNFISERLGIPQSSFSKITKLLVGYQLVERYHMSNNRKNIILKPTQYAIDLYNANIKSVVGGRFESLFKPLENVSDESLAAFTEAMLQFNNKLEVELMRGDSHETVKLIKKE